MFAEYDNVYDCPGLMNSSDCMKTEQSPYRALPEENHAAP